MVYDEKKKGYSLKYRKRKQHQVSLSFKLDEWTDKILPSIKKSGQPVASFIKQAINEKIGRDGL